MLIASFDSKTNNTFFSDNWGEQTKVLEKWNEKIVWKGGVGQKSNQQRNPSRRWDAYAALSSFRDFYCAIFDPIVL